DTLVAGSGSDILAGGEGTDLYVYNLGDGVDVIQDSGVNTLSFGVGIGVNDISLAIGSLKINVGDSGDAIHIEGFNPDDPYANVAINRFEFADGTVLSYQQLLNLGFDLNGTDGDDTIYGTAVDDRISGFAGNDTIIAKGGNDQLDGGAGADTLYGGQGDDTYLAVDSTDTIVEYADEGTDTIETDLDGYVLGDNLENLTLTVSDNMNGAGNFLDVKKGQIYFFK
ncbi:MAG: calcium-binding protein, partial [Thiohalophilus sp.]